MPGEDSMSKNWSKLRMASMKIKIDGDQKKNQGKKGNMGES
jgi:hypothetical protein